MNSLANHSTSYYVDLLSPLSTKEKLEIISQLLETMKPKTKSKSDKQTSLERLKDFEGSWGGDIPVSEYVQSLRSENLERIQSLNLEN